MAKKSKEKKRTFKKNKTYKVDFFVATHEGDEKEHHARLRPLS